jgi:LPS sulfotransferase NodH
VYEDFAPRYEETALELLDFLSIPRPADLEFGPRRMTRQADALNEEWLEQYRRDAGERAATLPATG